MKPELVAALLSARSAGLSAELAALSAANAESAHLGQRPRWRQPHFEALVTKWQLQPEDVERLLARIKAERTQQRLLRKAYQDYVLTVKFRQIVKETEL